MKGISFSVSFIFPLLGLAVGFGFLESIQAEEPTKAVEKKETSLAQEFQAEFSSTGGARTSTGGVGYSTVDEQTAHVRYVVSPEITPSFLPRLGLEGEQYSFGLPATRVPLPNTLRSLNAVAGFDYSFNDSWLMRFEISPGTYGDGYSTNSQTINAPLILGGSYLVNENLQWVFGLSVDLWRKNPVLPGVGVRWQFAPAWVLNFILPKPRVEYEVNKEIHVYVGGEIKGGTYRTGPNFGTALGRPGLNGAVVEYTEYRAGTGADWKVLPALTLEAEAGVMLERSFDYARAGMRVGSDTAPYGQVGVKASF